MVSVRLTILLHLSNDCNHTLAGGRIVPRFQELTPEKLGKVCLAVFLCYFVCFLHGFLTF